MSGSLLHAVVIYTLHRLFEQHFYRIISELFSSGSVLCVCLLTLIFQRVSLHIENGQMKGITVKVQGFFICHMINYTGYNQK